MNQGAWAYIQPRINVLLEKLNIKKEIAGVARPASASSATGVMAEHEYEKEQLFKRLFEAVHSDILDTPCKQFYKA